MKRYQDLLIHLPNSKFSDFIAGLVATLPEHWHRDNEKEGNIPSFSEQEMFCFQRTLEDGLDSSLWLTEKDENTLYVSNIVPTEKSSLSISEYNAVLTNFMSHGITGVIEKHKGSYEVTNEEYSLEDLISKETAKSLRVFSSCANKSTGSSHPNDKERWLSFVVLAFKDERTLPPEEVEEFLLEDGWSGNSAIELTIEYEFGQQLLEYAEANDVI
jgi:hypothetical protein